MIEVCEDNGEYLLVRGVEELDQSEIITGSLEPLSPHDIFSECWSEDAEWAETSAVAMRFPSRDAALEYLKENAQTMK